MTTPEQIMRACDHAGSRDSEYRTLSDERLRACWRCGNAAQAAWRVQRKAELAARPLDCARCGKRPHTWTVAGYKLCGRCRTATLREHHQTLAKAGALAIFATSLLVDTSGWACRQPTTEAQP